MSNNNGRGIFYGVIGVATLVVAVIGATFAYFTASITNNDAITGNAATVSLSVAVSKITTADDDLGGMIPMSNNMAHVALYGASDDARKTGDDKVCVDDAGNAVCQVYKIVLTNTSSAAVYVDGYVALANGSGNASDHTYTKNPKGTTMRWAQAVCTGADTNLQCSTSGTVYLGSGTDGAVSLNSISAPDVTSDGTTTTYGKNTANIKTAVGDVTGSVTINNNTYSQSITKNYIRVSDHAFVENTVTTGAGSGTRITFSGEESYNRTDDVTSALVYNQYVVSGGAATYYIVVWLSETGTNQTIDSAGTGNVATSNLNFFDGQVKFISAAGSEVSATFTSYSRTTA